MKIPRSYIESSTELLGEFEARETKPSPKQPSVIKRLFIKIDNSELVCLFKSTLNEVRQKCLELYENVTQVAACFLRASNQTFTPDDTLYGKLAAYHRLLEPEVDELMTRKTLNNYMKWFEDWRPVVGVKETHKEKTERFRHRLWERLTDWICSYLLQIASQYVFT